MRHCAASESVLPACKVERDTPGKAVRHFRFWKRYFKAGGCARQKFASLSRFDHHHPHRRPRRRRAKRAQTSRKMNFEHTPAERDYINSLPTSILMAFRDSAHPSTGNRRQIPEAIHRPHMDRHLREYVESTEAPSPGRVKFEPDASGTRLSRLQVASDVPLASRDPPAVSIKFETPADGVLAGAEALTGHIAGFRPLLEGGNVV
ncbi:hypothetical protein GGX14DRAFT_571799 [Mycena pura]|uniref:Uncharacterized protein n=1 Tax=Mycena pura TaxID=153505 RepID=A0AAD6Y4D9_9AGAR|nr:hypothetical protein GGX14DRAFT_571799 [Mycena pura]